MEIIEKKDEIKLPKKMSFIRSMEGIEQYACENGLTVLLFEDPSQSTVTVNITYLVGSRHEGSGEAGMAHLLEHMLFRSTKLFANVKAALHDRGAFYNGTTWFDRTNYYETLTATSENLRFALSLEADRMIHSLIRKEDLDAEMTVVRNEFEMGENNPVHVLHDQMMSAAYRWHNYGKTTIGNRSDIERVPVSSLRLFYERYYQPDNAVLVVAGKINKHETLSLIDELFGSIKKPDRVLNPTYTIEPPQDGPRNVLLKRTGDVSSVGLGYHIPSGSHPDYAAIKIAMDCLVDEPGGFLYKKFIESGACSELFASVYGLHDPGMALCFMRPTHNDQASSLQKELIFAIEHEAPSFIGDQQVERMKARAQKKMKMLLANSKEVALRLTETIASGDFRLLFWFREALEKVTQKDVVRVMAAYFVECNRTAGLFEPTLAPRQAEIPLVHNLEEALSKFQDKGVMAAGEEFKATAENIESRVKRDQMSQSLRCGLLSKKTRGQMVRSRLVFRFANEDLLTSLVEEFSMAPSLLFRGCEGLDYQGIRDKLDLLQSTMEIDGQAGLLSASLRCDREHVTKAISLLSLIFRKPSFDEKEFVIVQKRDVDDYEELRLDPQRRAFHELERLKYPWPKNNIHYVPSYDEKITRLKDLSIGSIRKAYETLFAADHLDVSLVGDFSADEVTQTLSLEFASFVKRVPFQRISRPFKENEIRSVEIDTPGKEMALIAMGTNFAMQDNDGDFPSLKFANYIFGENMNSRLMMRLREQEGLSYGGGSWLEVSRYEPHASFNMYAQCAPQNVTKAIRAIKETFQEFLEKGLKDDEFHSNKESIWLTYQNMLSNDNYVAGVLAYDQEVKRTFWHYENLYKTIRDLSKKDVEQALQKWWSKVQFSEVIAGDLKKIKG